ncbi:hypothetical protein ES703_115075 [subsurface metagenome]
MRKKIIISLLLVLLLFTMSGCFGGGGSTPEKPMAPTNLTTTATSYQEIVLSWVDNSNNKTGFKIYCSFWETWGYDLAGVMSENTTSAIHSGLDPLETRYYYIEAYNNTGTSSSSNIAKGTTEPGVELLNYQLGEKRDDSCITGQARNVTDIMLDSITITAWFYDAVGILLDTTSDYASDIPSQTTYNFEIRAFNIPLSPRGGKSKEKSLTPDQFLESNPDRPNMAPLWPGAFLGKRK